MHRRHALAYLCILERVTLAVYLAAYLAGAAVGILSMVYPRTLRAFGMESVTLFLAMVMVIAPFKMTKKKRHRFFLAGRF